MAKLCVHIMADVECWITPRKSAVLFPVLTHAWNHYFDNFTNESVQPAEGIQFYCHSFLQENFKRVSWGKKKTSNGFPSQKKLLHLNCTLTGLCSTQENMNFCCTTFFFFSHIHNYVFVLALPCSFFFFFCSSSYFFLVRTYSNAQMNKRTGQCHVLHKVMRCTLHCCKHWYSSQQNPAPQPCQNEHKGMKASLCLSAAPLPRWFLNVCWVWILWTGSRGSTRPQAAWGMLAGLGCSPLPSSQSCGWL